MWYDTLRMTFQGLPYNIIFYIFQIEEIRLKIMLKYWALYTAIENRTHTADDLSNEKYQIGRAHV